MTPSPTAVGVATMIHGLLTASPSRLDAVAALLDSNVDGEALAELAEALAAEVVS